MIIDTHAHLDMEAFDKDREQVLERALQEGIACIVTVGVDLSSSLAALEISRRHDFIFSAVGYHPHHAKEMGPKQAEALSRIASEAHVVAWGEIGLDFFHRHSPPEKQIDVFAKQLDLALDADLPVVIHDRDAHTETLEILKSKGRRPYRGVIHCFSGDYALATAFIDLGFHLSIPGVVTYRNARQMKEVASRMPIERMLVETDAPFLTPLPHRGKRNESAFVTHTVAEIARLRGITADEAARQTSENAITLFQLPIEP